MALACPKCGNHFATGAKLLDHVRKQHKHTMTDDQYWRARELAHADKQRLKLPATLRDMEGGSLRPGSKNTLFKCLLCQPPKEIRKTSALRHFTAESIHDLPKEEVKQWVVVADAISLRHEWTSTALEGYFEGADPEDGQAGAADGGGGAGGAAQGEAEGGEEAALGEPGEGLGAEDQGEEEPWGEGGWADDERGGDEEEERWGEGGEQQGEAAEDAQNAKKRKVDQAAEFQWLAKPCFVKCSMTGETLEPFTSCGEAKSWLEPPPPGSEGPPTLKPLAARGHGASSSGGIHPEVMLQDLHENMQKQQLEEQRLRDWPKLLPVVTIKQSYVQRKGPVAKREGTGRAVWPQDCAQDKVILPHFQEHLRALGKAEAQEKSMLLGAGRALGCLAAAFPEGGRATKTNSCVHKHRYALQKHI